MKVCAVCGLPFTPCRPNQVACDAECRAERRRQLGRAFDRKRYAEDARYRAGQVAKSQARFASDPAYRAGLAAAARRRRALRKEASASAATWPVVVVAQWWIPASHRPRSPR